MGKNNRQRRAAKHRQRHRAGSTTRGSRPCSGASTPVDPEFAAYALRRAIIGAAEDHAAGVSDAADRAVRLLAGPGAPYPPDVIAHVVEDLLAGLLDVLVGAGWQPLDLRQLTTRQLSARHVPVLGQLLAQQAAAHPAGRIDPRWTRQLREFGPASADRPGTLLTAGRRIGLDGLTTLTLAVELLGLLPGAPKLVPVLLPPGQFAGTAVLVSDSQERVLARVRALLAKAESTEFAEEAEALTAKAQDLMSRHSLERLLAQHRRREADPVTAARIWLDAPYAIAKSLLVQEVAEANRTRAVWSEHLGCVTLLGREPDLVAIELLTTSLLVQATRAMVADQPMAGRRTRSFRQSFLVAFAGRIGERLGSASDGAAEDVSEADRAELLPVLRAVSARVDEAVDAAFPGLVHRRVSVSNGLGWAAGRAAADLALLDVRGQVEGPGDPGLAEIA